MFYDPSSGTIRIVRIENKRGGGPYSDGNGILCGIATKRTPVAKKWHNGSSNVKYGFLGFRQLNNWFTKEELADLNRNGFFISIYRAKPLYVDRKQVYFDMATAKCLKRVDIIR